MHQVTRRDEVSTGTRERIAALVDAEGGLATAARKLGVSRGGLANYLVGRAQRGTALLIETSFDALGGR